MAKLADDVLRRIRADPEGFVLQVQGVDLAAAADALALAREDLWSLDASDRARYGLGPGDRAGLAYVSEVVPSPTGPLVYVDASGLPDRIALETPRIVLRRLDEAGLADAIVVSPPLGGPLDDLAEVPRAVALVLLPPPTYVRRGRTTMPESWLHEAEAWVRCRSGEERVWLAMGGVQIELEAESLRPLLVSFRASRESCLAVAGHLHDRVVGFNIGHKVHPSLVLASGGPAASNKTLLEDVESLKDVARRLAPELGYGFIAIEARLATLAYGHPLEDHSAGLAGWDEVWWTCDRLALDAFCWQVLGPGHLARLNSVPDRLGSLDGGRVELAIGEPADWLPDRPERAERLSFGRHVLAGCLVDGDTAFDLLQDLIEEAD